MNSTVLYSVLRDHKQMFAISKDQYQLIDLCDLMIGIRSGTTDMDVFYQIFFKHEYKIPFKLRFEIKRVIDCGANVGYFWAWMLLTNPGIEKIVSVEPDPSNFEAMQSNLAMNGKLNSKVNLLNCGVWSRRSNLTVDHVNGEWGFQVREDDDGPITGVSIEEIYESSSSFLYRDIDVLKIDIEGTEMEIFNNDPKLPRFLDHRCKLVICETHERFKPGSHDAVMSKIGHWKHKLVGDNWFFLNPRFS